MRSQPRTIIDLSGVWQYALQLDEAKITEEQQGWEEMPVPSNWHLAGLAEHSGTVYFRREFDLPEITLEKAVHLRFHGVDYFTTVWLNGTYLGDHEGYFQPFCFDITDVAMEKNELIVKVTSPKESPQIWPDNKWLIKGIFGHHDCRPGGWSKEHGQDGNTGGIWNKVEVYVSDKIYVERLLVNPVLLPDGSARLKVTARLKSRSPDTVEGALRITHRQDSIEVTVAGARREIHLQPGMNEVIFIQTIQSPELWWTWDHGSPHLYHVELILSKEGRVLDRLTERCGIRKFIIGEGDTWHQKHVWYLNDHPILPRGTNFIPTQWLSEYTKEMIDNDIRLLKEANINAIRVHGHVNRKELYDACDEAGILVWQDFALQWGYDQSDAFVQNASSQIRDMAQLLYNHPSIIVWCCHNESLGRNAASLDPILQSVLSETDSTRHTTMNSGMGTHSYPGWYYGSMTEYRESPARPLVTEFGAQALPNVETLKEMFADTELFPPDWEKWEYHNFGYHETFNIAKIQMGDNLESFVKNSQEYQARLLQFAIENYRRAKYQPVTGIFQFMFVDSWPSISWSVVDYRRRPKAGYYAMKRAYQPVLISVSMREDAIAVSGSADFDVFVVNALHRTYDQARARTQIRNPSRRILFGDEAIVDVPSDAMTKVGDPFSWSWNWTVPSTAEAGQYTIEVELRTEKGELLSQNFFNFTVHEVPVWHRRYWF